MDCRLGVVALGDSITNGGGELQWGVALQSWALWTARGLGLPYTGVAADGARAADVVARQLAPWRRRRAGAGTSAACTSGVNDVRALDFDPAGFARDHLAALEFLAARCERVLARARCRVTSGGPPAGHLAEGNETVSATPAPPAPSCSTCATSAGATS